MAIVRCGFFDDNELTDMSVGKNLIDDPCKKCGLFKTCKSPKMPITGQGKRKIYILAEASGKQEDEQNTQLIGRAGTLLRERLAERGIDLDIDCWKDNSTRCRPKDDKGENRKPTKQEIKYCKDNIDKSIKELQPDFIWLFGKSALESFYMNRFSDLEVSNWRNLCIPDRKTGAYIFPMYHPSYPLRNENDAITNAVFDRDLDFAVRNLTLKPFQHVNHLECVYPLKSYTDITDILDIVLKEKNTFAFDYETTGLKPFNEGHRIACISGCDSDDYAFSFLYDHDKANLTFSQFEAITELWIKILLDPEIIKVAQNSKFESVWSRWIFKIPKVESFDYCTMNSAHIIDNQKGVGLKYQTYINFGIDDYSKSIKKYLEDTDAKGFNKVMEAPINDLLLYSGIDSLVTKWLWNKQSVFFQRHPEQEKARQFFQKGLDVFADMQITGINTDVKYYSKEFLSLTDKIDEKDEKLNGFKEVQKFKDMFHKDIDFESTTDLRKLFFSVMNLKSKNKTTTGLDATDKNAINEIDHPIAKVILEKRRFKKMRDYVGMFLREINDEDQRIRPFFNLHVAKTYRSGSDSPNWQNIPVRDEEAKKVTRLGILPTKGNKILDWDYGAIEVRAAACHTKDPVLIEYINNPATDMHRDTAAELFKLDPKQVSKDIRFYAKNGFVFPEFYGSYFVSTAKTLWAEVPKLKLIDGTSLFLHLNSKAILTYEHFENHVKQVEKEYWIKFKVFKKWQEQVLKDYAKTGFIETFFGFRMGGYLGKNEIINYRFQSVAFHCLLWSIIELTKEIKQRKLKTKIIGQIHDCCLYDLVPEEQDEIIALSKEIATERIRKVFPWIIVPLIIEVESTEINSSWLYKQEIKT